MKVYYVKTETISRHSCCFFDFIDCGIQNGSNPIYPKNENPIKSPKDPPRDPSNQISSWICISSCIVLEFDVNFIINWTWDKFPVSGVRNASSLLFAIFSIRTEYCVISFCSKHVKMFSWILFAATVWESDWWHLVLKSKFRIWYMVLTLF